jgi:hypothetical protein
MAKDNNEPTLKLPATVVQQLRKLAADHEHKFRKFSAALAGVGNPTFTPAHLEQLADLSSHVSNCGGIQVKTLTPGQRISLDEIGDSIPDELARLRELIAELKTSASSAPPVASSAPKKRKAWQVDRILEAIPKVFPNGDIEGIPDSEVREKVGNYLQPEIRTKGLAVPSPDSFDRALRQYRTR